MILAPKKYKFAKSFSGKKVSTNKFKNTNPNFSNLCLIAEQKVYISNFQQNAIKNHLKRQAKKNFQVFFRLFPKLAITKKPNEVRLGCGKGNVKYWTNIVQKDDVILEIRCDRKMKKIANLLNSLKVKISTKTYLFDKHFRWIL